MIHCIVIEDQEPAQRILKRYIQETSFLKLDYIFNNGIAALDYLKSHSVDLIFLDIHLPKLSGIDFLTILPVTPQIILTTAFPDYALKSYDFDVTDYLLKPFSFDRFSKAVLKVQKLHQNHEIIPPENVPNSTLVKIGYEYVTIIFNDILYIQSDGDYTQVHLKNQKLMTSHPLKYWQTILPEGFYQIHRSFIIHTKYISKISGGKVFIENTPLTIGRVYKKGFLETYCSTK